MLNKEYLKNYYQSHKEQIIARSHARYIAHWEEIRIRNKANHIKNRARHILSSKIGHYRRNFGISLAERDRILAKGCQICEDIATQIDHSHLTGKVRGGLCNSCNTGLGMFHDNTQRLMRAINYLNDNR